MNPKTGDVNAFQTVWNLINDQDVYGDQSGNDVGMRGHYKELFEEIFSHYLKTGEVHSWWNKLQSRTDLSEDVKMAILGEEPWFDRLLFMYDNLHTQGLI